MSDLIHMIEHATQAMQRAYAPYSNFQVGACIKSSNGNYYSGGNIENASYGLTLCAEGSAIAHMINQGETEITDIVIVNHGDELCTPCGACRQRLNEFAKHDINLYICGKDGVRLQTTLSDILPHAFGPHNLQG